MAYPLATSNWITSSGLASSTWIGWWRGAADGGSRRPNARGDALEGGPLEQCRHEDHEEDGIEDRLALGDVLGEDERAEHDRHGASEPCPAEKGALAVREGTERRRQHDGDGADHEREQESGDETGHHHRGQIAREDEQAEDDEHRHLGEEGEVLVEVHELAAVAGRRAADRQPDEVDGEEAAAAEHVGDSKGKCSGSDRRHRREGADRPRELGEDPGRDVAERDPDGEADPELLHHQEEDVVDPKRRVFDPVDQAECEGDRDRVVEACLTLERSREATPHLGVTQGRKDGGRVGRGDDAAEQNRLRPIEIEDGVGHHACEDRGDDDSDRAQECGWNRDVPEPPPRGREPALVEDRDEADDSDRAGELGVVELDPADPVRPKQHPEREKRDERRHAGARGSEADGDARGKHCADDQEECAFVHPPFLPLSGAAACCRSAQRTARGAGSGHSDSRHEDGSGEEEGHGALHADTVEHALAIIGSGSLWPSGRATRGGDVRASARQSESRAGALARGCPGAGDRDQRRPDPGAEDRDLRHRPPHPLVGCLGAEDDPGAARDRARVRRRDRRDRLERERLPPGRHRQRRGPRRLRPLPQLHGGQTAPVRALDRPRGATARSLRRAGRAADDEHLAPLAGRRRGSRRHLRPVRQRRPHGAHVPGARGGRARHRGRPDRLHGGRGRPPCGRPSRRRLRPELLPARAGAADGGDGRRRPDHRGARRDPVRARDDGGLRRRARDVGSVGRPARPAAGDGPRRPHRPARDPDRRGADRLHPDRVQHADAEGHLRP